MSEATNLLSWLQWSQVLAQKIALVGSALFAGILLQRAWAMSGASAQAIRSAAANAARSSRHGTAIAAVAAACALWAGLIAGAGPGFAWLIAALAEGLCAIYCATELRRTRMALAGMDPHAESLAGPWLVRWHSQHRWLALHAAWVPWLLVMSL
jgi:hypothetical protein